MTKKEHETLRKARIIRQINELDALNENLLLRLEALLARKEPLAKFLAGDGEIGHPEIKNRSQAV